MPTFRPNFSPQISPKFSSVEIWDRFLKQTLPAAVIKEVVHEEKKLGPLHEDIERNVSRLRAQLFK